MSPILVWTQEPGWLSKEAYPEVHRRFRISPLAADAELPREPGVLLLDAERLEEREAAIEAFARQDGDVTCPIIALAADADRLNGATLVFDVVGKPPSEAELVRALRNASHFLESELRLAASQRAAEQKARELEELHEIGIALSAERDHDRLLNLILSKAREITNADAGSLFLVSRMAETVTHPGGGEERVGARWLKFRLLQNDSRDLTFEEDILPISPDSIAGYVAQTGETLNLEDAYNPPEDKPFAINRSFDEATGYRTRSILVIPMQNHEGENIGVLQLINKKTSRDLVLESPESFERDVRPFDEHDERLVRSLASQAAISVENNHLYRQRENLFHRFVQAAVKAIERRDPTTEGHSKRVADMTEELARVTSRADRGIYRDLVLSSEQVKELRYAALLHDFGKVGVTEKVLRKATKLHHGRLSEVRQRFKTIHRSIEALYMRRMLDRLLQQDASPEEIERLKADLSRRLRVVEEARRAVEEANKPTVKHHAAFDRLQELGQLTYEDLDGAMRPYLDAEEIEALMVPKGSLTRTEYGEIMNHVSYTFEFLSQIPWTQDLQFIPDFARSHHEKLDGSGYPSSLTADEIPPQTRMMTIADIYDALTASDRPYKPAVSTPQALDILHEEGSLGRIDRDLLSLFIEGKVFEHGLVT